MLHIYYMKFQSDCSREQSLALYQQLPVERRQRIDRLKNRKLADKHIQAGAMLGDVLSKETKIPGNALIYLYEEQGKPALDYKKMESAGVLIPKHPIWFNLSHSGDYAVVGISDKPVGIDIEHKARNVLTLSKRCFAPEEYEDIAKQETEEKQKDCFLQYWTMKEAYIKYTGEGLSCPLNSFSIERGERGISQMANADVWFNSFWLSNHQYCVSVTGEDKQDVTEGTTLFEYK